MPPSPYVVVVWGDSIAAGDANMNWPTLAERMCNLAVNTGRPVKVFNEAVGGKPAAHARAEFEQRVLSHKPDLVILQFGYNDIRHDGGRGRLPISTPEEFEQHLAELVRRCRDEAGARVVVFGNHRTRTCLRMPTGRMYDETVTIYREAARRVAQEAGVHWRDMSAELALPNATWTDFICDDGVHLSTLGCWTYGRIAANVIQEMMEAAGVLRT